MTKDVIVYVKGIQKQPGMPDEETEEQEYYTAGTYYEKDGKQYLFYQEYLGDDQEVPVKNSLRMEEGQLTIGRKGAVNSRMILALGQKTVNAYESPMGMLLLGCHTSLLQMTAGENEISIQAEYELWVDEMHVSDNRIEVRIQGKKGLAD